MIHAELTKRFGVHEVLRAAKLTVRAGTVHALVGENGAGKSTLVKLVAGMLRADRGTLRIADTSVEIARWDRVAARRAGIGIVQQHGASAETLTVVENAVLGVEPGAWLELDAAAAALKLLGDSIGLPIDPWARVESLSLGAAQRAEIVTALHHGATTLMLDEPTAVLTPVEVEGLLATLRRLADQGRTIVIVTHKLDEVRAVADDVTVLRAGETVATFSAPLEVGAIARAMVGAEPPVPAEVRPPAGDAPVTLAVTRLSVGQALVDVDLAVQGGEIVGVAGVDGNGQRELALAITGLASSRGSVCLGARDVTADRASARLAAGLAHIPEDRQHGGLLLDWSVADNLALGRTDITGRWRVDRAAVERAARERIAELDIRPPEGSAIVRSLSGGNQQKILVGRELSRPGLIAVVASQPTRGVDLGAVARIHDRLRAAALAGAGVLVISADLDELLTLCHRIVVLLRGRIVGELAGAALRDGTARASLGTMMTGAA